MIITHQQQINNPCIYCSLPEIKARIIFENNLVYAFPTNIPITSGHIIITTKKCTKRLEDLTTAERLAIFDFAEKIMKSLKSSYGADGFNCAWNQERLAGQSVPHFHLHIIPRKEGDTGLLGYDPRSMLYRTGEREPIKEKDILKVRDLIRKNL